MIFLALCACTQPSDAPALDSVDDSPGDSLPFEQVTWDLDVTGDDYPHIGQTVGMNVVRADTDALVGQGFYVLDDNSITLHFPDVLADDVDHVIDWYADNNEDGLCNDGDHAWTVELPAVTQDTALVLDHVNSAPFDYAAACSHF